MQKKLIWIFFGFTTFFTLFGTAFITHVRFLPYTAFLAYITSKKPLKSTICYSFLCGLILDLFTTELPFGSYSVMMILSTSSIYPQKWLIFHDKFFSLFLNTFIISFNLSLITWFSKILLGLNSPLSFTIFLREALLMPLFDGVFAFVCLTLPLKGLQILKKKGFNFYFLRKLD